MGVDDTFNLAVSLGMSAATLVVISLGLAVIFGMMGVINFAHGEFLMLGAFLTLSGVRAGLPLAAAMVLATLGLALFGMLVERVLIRRLYGRLQATMLATFGLSLILVQVAIMIWGTSTPGISMPLGSVQVGSYSVAIYRLVVIAAAIALLALVWVVFTRTSFGLMARAAAADATMAAALGVNARRLNMYTFSFGAGLAGAGGAILAPLVAVSPTMGAVYVPQSFMTVVVGGAGVITGTAGAAGLLGVISQVVSNAAGPVMGVSALLLTAVVVIRVLPTGLSGKLRKDL